MNQKKIGQIFSFIEDNKQVIILGGIVTSIGLFLCGYLHNIVINGSIMLYLSYTSFKVLGAFHDHPFETEIIVLLLRKWILFSCLMIIENLTGYLLRFPFIGLCYSIFKLFFLALLLQNSEHLTTVYDIANQGFKVYEDKLDKYIEMAEDYAKQFRDNYPREVNQYNIYDWMSTLTGYLLLWKNDEPKKKTG